MLWAFTRYGVFAAVALIVAPSWSPVTGAGRRNDAIHTSVYHHLTVVIVAVIRHPRRDFRTRLRPEICLERIQRVLLGQRSHRLAGIRNRSFQIRNDRVLAPDVVRPVVVGPWPVRR